MPVVFVFKVLIKVNSCKVSVSIFCITKTETFDSLITSDVSSHETMLTPHVWITPFSISDHLHDCCW